MNKERRMFERENVNISFVYSLDEGQTLADGTWNEGVTEDLGPVLVGGMAFYAAEPLPVDAPIRIALFMDLQLREVWLKEADNFPTIYHGRVLRVVESEGKYRVAIVFQNFEIEHKPLHTEKEEQS